LSLAHFQKLRNYLIGSEAPASRSEFKRLMLTVYLAVICMVVAVIYTVLDLISNIYYSQIAYFFLFSTPLLALYLIRRKKYKIAKVILLICANLVVFWTALIDPFETGVFLLFIPTGIGSFAMLGFEDNKTGILLALLTAVLFLIAFFGDLKFIAVTRPSEDYIKISFVFNYFTAMVISVLVVYFQMTLNSMSENDLIQKEIFANQKNKELQKVNEELDRFVYSVSHDLRSPLSSILGLINIARLTKEPAEISELLSMVEGRVHAQDHFIREIIDYSRNARTETVNESITLRTLVEEVFFSLKFNDNADKIDFKNEIPENTRIISDRIRLTVILSNLIGNAIKYHDFRKDKPYIEIGIDENTDAIYVKDNGMGMKQEHQDKIFNMFYRGSDRSSGSGLGLFITKEAATKLGGGIQVSSVYGEGSTFKLTIPFQRI
jgi:signal transduction histidine kinase